MLTEMTWLPDLPNWAELLDQAHGMEPEHAFEVFRGLANSRLDFVRAGKLDKSIAKYRERVGEPTGWTRIRLAVLGSSTLTHLSAGIRLGALRRGVLVDLYEGHYGMYRQELEDPASGLHGFRPEVVCLALDAHHVAGAEQASVDGVLA